MNDITKYIEGLEVNETELKSYLRWLSVHHNNAMQDFDINNAIIFLLRRVDELERRLNELEK